MFEKMGIGAAFWRRLWTWYWDVGSEPLRVWHMLLGILLAPGVVLALTVVIAVSLLLKPVTAVLTMPLCPKPVSR